MTRQTVWVLLWAFLVFLPFNGGHTTAHEIQPSIADFSVAGGDRYEISIRTNAEALLAGIGAQHEDTADSPNASTYDALRELPAEELKARFEAFAPQFLDTLAVSFDGERVKPELLSVTPDPVGDTALARDTVILIGGPIPAGATTFTWAWPAAYGTSVIRVTPATGPLEEGYSAYLNTGEASEPIDFANAVPPSVFKVIGDYIVLGFTHILPKGLDHILFVTGLFLLSTHWRPLLWQVTAFTLAHTVTLALGVLGYVSVPPSIVEPLIALSIVYVAVENILTDHLHRWRPVVVFCFGLLHGLGFAGVLEEIGLSSTHFVAGLIAFNVGVELGQLAVIAICFLTVGVWFGAKPWYRDYITTPASVAIAVIASWWVYERVFLA